MKYAIGQGLANQLVYLTHDSAVCHLCADANSKAWMQVLSDICLAISISVAKMCAYIRNAGASESKKAVGVVTFHDAHSSSGSGDRQSRSTANCNQLQVEQFFSLLLVIIPDLHDKGLLSLVLQVTQVTRDRPQVCFSGLCVKLMDLTSVQLSSVEANILQKTCVPLLPIRI